MTGTATGHVVQNDGHEALALVVGERELLRIVGQDADAVDAGIDQEVDDPLLARVVDLGVFIEWRRGDRDNPAQA